MSKTRESGFFWIRYGSEWEVAEWDDYKHSWGLCGATLPYKEDELLEIDERRIVREEPKHDR